MKSHEIGKLWIWIGTGLKYFFGAFFFWAFNPMTWLLAPAGIALWLTAVLNKTHRYLDCVSSLGEKCQQWVPAKDYSDHFSSVFFPRNHETWMFYVGFTLVLASIVSVLVAVVRYRLDGEDLGAVFDHPLEAPKK